MTRTYLDAGALIAAARGDDAVAQRALEIVKDRELTSALIAGADDLVTTERPTRPIHRVSGLSVKTIHPHLP